MSVGYLAGRLLSSVVVVVGVVTLTFLAARLLPADPARLYAGPRAQPAALVAIRARYGLDRPLPEQYVRYVGGLLTGEWGTSFKTKRSVRADLAVYLPATLELVLLGYGLALGIGIPFGCLAALRAGGWLDRTAIVGATLAASTPVFALALLGQQLFVNELHMLPLNGRLSANLAIEAPIRPVTGFYLVDAALMRNWVGWGDALAHLALPAVVVAVYPLSVVLRMTRAAVAAALAEPHIVVARAKGMTEWTILRRHVLPNAMLPVLTIGGLTFAYAVTGSVLVELLFRWPGIGAYVTDAILARDFPAILAVTLVSTLIFVAITLAIDLLRAVLDPRMRVRP